MNGIVLFSILLNAAMFELLLTRTIFDQKVVLKPTWPWPEVCETHATPCTLQPLPRSFRGALSRDPGCLK